MNLIERCAFYAQEKLSFTSREVTPHQQAAAASVVMLPYCKHPKHSPARLVDVKGRIGGANILTCGGDFGKCPIAEMDFMDV